MAIKDANDIEPEFLDLDGAFDVPFLRYLYENFDIIKKLLEDGITAQFITVNDQLITVVKGIVTFIEPSFNGTTDALLLEVGDYFLLESGDRLLLEETVIA